MAKEKPKRVREQAVVYLTERDRELLEQMAEATGLSRTELFRRGLRRLAQDTLGKEKAPGSAFGWLVENAIDDGFPPDVSERHDYYLYGGGYEKILKEREEQQK